MLCFLGIFVHATYALYTNVEDEANDLGSLRQNGASLHNIFMVKFCCGLVIMKFEHALNESKVIVLKLKESGQHIDKVLLVMHFAFTSFVGGTAVTLLLYDTCSIIKGTSSDKALLPSRSNDVQNKTIGGKLLAALHPEYVANLDIGPRYGYPSLDPARNHQPLNLLAVDDV